MCSKQHNTTCACVFNLQPSSTKIMPSLTRFMAELAIIIGSVLLAAQSLVINHYFLYP